VKAESDPESCGCDSGILMLLDVVPAECCASPEGLLDDSRIRGSFSPSD
jgi:hypothetical protein